jgi:phage shock protein A
MGESLKLNYSPSNNLIKVRNMNNLISWLMGDTLGGLIMDSWNWLWQTPSKSTTQVTTVDKNSDDITLEHATQLLVSIAARVLEIKKAVERVRAITHEIKRQYDVKCQQHQELVATVLEYKRLGEIVEARMAMANAIGIERILPELQARLEHSQEMLISINECHTQEQSKLSLLEIEMETIKACMAMNESMGGNQELGKFNDLSNLQEKFRNVQTEIEDRYQQVQIMGQLADKSNFVAQESLNIQDVDERIKSLGN